MGEKQRWFLIVVFLGVFYWLCYVHYTRFLFVGTLGNHVPIPRFKKHPDVANLNCAPFFNLSTFELKFYSKISLTDPQELSMSCKDINIRRSFVSRLYPEEVDFNLAFVRAVYKDYTFHELELSANYRPNNYYCYVLDSKSDQLFKNRIRGLSECFENVIVAEKEFNMTSDGKNIIPAQYYCLDMLLTRKWKYVLMLENYDMMIKTNRELVQILKLYDGANDVSASSLKTLTRERVDFVKNNDWSLKNLQIFRNAALNVPYSSLIPVKSLTQSSLSYEAVHHMFNVLNLKNFIKFIDQGQFAQELFIGTLNANELLKIPGGFTSKCPDLTVSMTRFTRWRSKGCQSRRIRHRICILDMHDLQELAQSPRFTANKMLQEFDFGSISCWHEYIYNRQHFQRNVKINNNLYLNLPHVKYHRMKKEGRLREAFNCSELKALP